ncbi:putative disease resistance protein RGA4 [Phragmites australis]|uniref:putative disease resistance protein RGA4 n=1 Tax=Phragmites australis TaxID=29695 RepID=UPI002D76B146|nr:putative disease resistance protein RGA4 [Phragmites australis]XP_062193046.1 putative disease resistance protein RGA4 [Phragmites australis]
MGTILDALTSKFLTKLGEIIQDEVVITLSVKKDIKRLKKNLEHFSAVREDAEALAMQDRGIESWWKSMTDVMFDVDDIIDHFTVHSQKLVQPPRLVCCNQSLFSCFTKLSFDHRAAKRIKDINEKLDEIKMNREMFSLERTNHQQFQMTVVDRTQTSPIDELEVVGKDIKQAADDMVKMIVSNCHENKSTVFGIQGMGGIGKTTLAQRIYNEQRIRERFQVHIWLCISQSYTEIGLLKQAIRMAGATCDQLETKTELLPHLMDTIRGKSLFLVLDDVWKSDVWIDLLRTPFERCLNAHILVTTRDLDVLAEMHATYTHQVNKMNDYDGLELLVKKSFRPYEQISESSDVGYQIVKKCDGLPLAIKVVAGVLSTKRTKAEWESIRDSQWSIHGLPRELGGPLYLSYSNLPPQLKQCFLWCALLPPNFDIKRDAVAYWWVAEGFVRKEHKYSVHEIAEEYYHELIRRNLLQPKPEFVDKCVSTMHDLLRSLGQYLTKDHSLFMNAENNKALSNLRRLCISSAIEEIPAIEEQKCMRSLLIFNNKNFKSLNEDIFRKLEHIRILVMSGTGIQSVPESVGNLVMLRLLDLSFTKINKLPESIGSLISLEYLSLRGCYKLNSLPASLIRLSNISFLHLDQAAIDHVPEGITKFQQLYNLRGVFESGTGFRLDELQCLPNIQRLSVEKLEKATPGGALVLKKSRNLRELWLHCTMGMSTHDRTHYQANEVERIQQVCEMLIPSPSLLYIFLVGFPGVRLPEWLCSEPEHKLPNLAHMHLNECISCSQLPPAGQMPELLVLNIRGADAVVSIGAELLGKGVISAAAFFPKLELLHIIDMRNLESWSLNTGNLCDNMDVKNQQLVLMPCLKRLLLLDCPKLRALPEDLHSVVNLKRIHIEGAHKLQEVANLPVVVWLKVKNNRCLRRISNLCKLQDLFAQDCPELDQAESLSSLKRLYMVDCPNAQQFRKCVLKEEQDVLVHAATLGGDGRDIFPDESLYN